MGAGTGAGVQRAKAPTLLSPSNTSLSCLLPTGQTQQKPVGEGACRGSQLPGTTSEQRKMESRSRMVHGK